MNKRQLDIELAKDHKFIDDYVETLLIEQIDGSEEAKSQVRQGGIDNTHLSELMDSIVSHGQLVPITVEKLKDEDDDGPASYKLVDGGHRFLATKRLHKNALKGNKNSKYASIRAHIKTFPDEFARQSYQLDANDHSPPAKSTTNDDALYWLHKLVDGGIVGAPESLVALQNSHHRNIDDAADYKKDLTKTVETQFPSLGQRRVGTIVKNFMKEIPGKLRTWNSARATEEFEKFVDYNDIDITTAAGYSLIMIREKNHVFQTCAGNALVQTSGMLNKDRINVAIVWSNQTAGKTFKELDEARCETIRKLNELNAHNKLGKGKRFIDEVFLAPQKQEDIEEKGFYHVPKTGQRRFALHVPAKGWDSTLNPVACAAK